MKNMIHLLGIFLFAQGISAAGQGQELLTSKEQPTCSSSAPCVVTENMVDFKIHFETEKFGALDVISKVLVRNSKSGIVVSYDIKDNDGFEPGSQVKIYTTDLNSDGLKDLALYAGTNPQSGHLYYYFIFNPKTKKFVMSHFMAPELQPGKSRGVLESSTSNDKFTVDSKYALRQK